MTAVLVYMKVDHFSDFQNFPFSPSYSVLLELVQGMFPAEPASPKNQIQY